MTGSVADASTPGGRLFIGTAGWAIPRATAALFEGEGSHLARYARRLAGAEINSSFHRPHTAAQYAKWAGATPPGFRFAVKLPRTITHDKKLRRCREDLQRFLDESAGLGTRRGPLLIQLPPSFAYDARVAGRFLELLRAHHPGEVVCEPRHPTWFSTAAERLLVRFSVARVAADPPTAPEAERPGGWKGLVYYRLHGSPRKYWSRYEHAYLDPLIAAIRATSPRSDVWCIFDNTASGAALQNAWEVSASLAAAPATLPPAVRAAEHGQPVL